MSDQEIAYTRFSGSRVAVLWTVDGSTTDIDEIRRVCRVAGVRPLSFHTEAGSVTIPADGLPEVLSVCADDSISTTETHA